MPEWYEVLRAARALGVAPWELEQQAAVWADWALAAEAAEAKALEAIRKRGF